MGLVDLGLQGGDFTWCNNKVGEDFTWVRLDRGFVNHAWKTLYPHVCVLLA